MAQSSLAFAGRLLTGVVARRFVRAKIMEYAEERAAGIYGLGIYVDYALAMGVFAEFRASRHHHLLHQ